jgi:hypothetical protein
VKILQERSPLSWEQSTLREPHGGPIKDYMRFKEPKPAVYPDYDDEESSDSNIDTGKIVSQLNDKVGLPYYDGVQNTVWMPRRRGEKEVKVDFDDYDPMNVEKYYSKSDLEQNGGVDCGRFPYSVRRLKNRLLSILTHL